MLGPLATGFLRHELESLWAGKFPFTTFYPAVALAAWLGGLGPGLLASALATGGALSFLPSLGTPGPDRVANVIALALFASVNVLISVLSEALHRARRRAELTRDILRVSEARLRGVVTSATDAIITIDAEQRILLFNAGAEAIFGQPSNEMIGRRLDRLIPERFRGIHRWHVDGFGTSGIGMRAMGGERVLAGLRRSGEEFPMEAHISQVEVEGRKLYTAILRDVTERRKAEAEREHLLDLAERARGAAEAALETLGRMQSITEAALVDLPFDDLLHELVNRVREALEGDMGVLLLAQEDGALHARAAAGLEEDIRKTVRVPIGRGFAGRIAKERRPLVLNGVRYDELVSPYFREKAVRSLVGVPLLSGQGRVLGVLHVGSFRPRTFDDDDVRLLQLAAERVALAVERASRIVVEHRAREEAEAASRAKDEFLAMLGHELRNPLAAVRNAVEAARRDDARRAGALGIACRQADQLGRLIDDLLDVARITQGRIALRKERVSLAEVIHSAVEGTRSLMEERHHVFSVLLPSDDIRVEVDPARVEQVVVNLLTNAAKYTEPEGHVAIVIERQGDEAVIRVRDSGMGIPADVLPRVFDLFTQAPRALDRAQGGLGIGLTIVRRLVELHGGRVEAYSDGVGRGAEFLARLPALSASPDEVAPPREAPARPGRARIVVVEDNRDIAASLAMVLELFGHHVRVVSDGRAALAAAQATVPDAMLIDIGLPGMNGYEVARRIRDRPDLTRVVLIALTGYGREEDRQRAFAAGFDHHLVKPVSPEALQHLVGQLGEGAPAESSTIH